MCKVSPTCDFDRIHWLPLTDAARAKVSLCMAHKPIVDAAAPCSDSADVPVAVGMSGASEMARRRCERPNGHTGPHHYTLAPHLGFQVA